MPLNNLVLFEEVVPPLEDALTLLLFEAEWVGVDWLLLRRKNGKLNIDSFE